ncbi:MAG TPA: acyclic terpene utilization AtuA family protein [Candidatus Acidoferrales bacterium]|nr:acyclic terpene utilization AtuA family protein [Candidatus Acidoferrales bacterium]
MKEHIRIASGQGYWGDLPQAPYWQVSKGPIDYLVMDYLAEVTMSILQKQKSRDPKLGYAKDLLTTMEQILPIVIEKNIKIITNGGGVNPRSCRDAIYEIAKKCGAKGLKIGIVHGDDIYDRIDDLLNSGTDLKNMDTGETLRSVREHLRSANVYFGAFPIAQALKEGAQIVLTGRTTDTGLSLAPMIYEFGWNETAYDKLAAGIVAGHILECGGQSSGGNFLKDWKRVPDLANIGFPIAEASPDGTFYITKHDATGGMVSVDTVKEQLIYEIGDPKEYITPEVVADFTTINLEQAGQNRVKVFGIKGKAPTDFYKVSMSYLDGYYAVGTLTYGWPEALEKAQLADKIIRQRLKDLGFDYDEFNTEFLGYDSCHGPLSPRPVDINEIVLRVAVRSKDEDAVDAFGRQLVPLVLTGPPTVTGFGSGRPKPQEVIAYWPSLIKKSLVNPVVEVVEL